MYTVALIAQKGGTGKTTLAVSLAVAAGQVGMTSIIIDLDPQGTACNWKDRRKSDGPVVIDAQPGRLAAALVKAEENGVDFAVIDTPARNEQSALAAAKAADLVLIPCRPQAYDLETIPNTKEILTLAGNKPAVVVLNAVPAVGDRHEQARELLNRLQIPVCPYTLGHLLSPGFFLVVGVLKFGVEIEPAAGPGGFRSYRTSCSFGSPPTGRLSIKRSKSFSW